MTAPDTPARWTVDDDNLVFTDPEGYRASLTRFGGNAALAAGYHALVADVRAARVHEGCAHTTDTLRQSRELVLDMKYARQSPLAPANATDIILGRLLDLLTDGGTDG